ncbi:MAG: type I restriction endonuclease subunit M, partial [Candidatus Latescibacterota bacterium]
MPLFHSRVLQPHYDVGAQIPPEHHEVLEAWKSGLQKGAFMVETQNDGEFIQRILIEVLGYKGSGQSDRWTVAKNQQAGKGNVDAALGTFSATTEPNIIAPFELKGARTRDLDAIMPTRNKTPVQQAWEYA